MSILYNETLPIGYNNKCNQYFIGRLEIHINLFIYATFL